MNKLLKLLKPYTLIIIIAFIFTFIQSICNLYLPTLMADIVNSGVVGQDMNKVFDFGKQMLLVTIISMFASIAATYIAARVSTGYARKIREAIYAKVETFSVNEFNKISTSSLITRTTNDVTQVQTLTLMTMRLMIMAPMMCIGGTIMAMSKNLKLSILFAVVIPILVIIIAIVAKLIVPYFAKVQKYTDRLNEVVREKLTGVKVIRAFGKEEYEKERFNIANTDIYEVSKKIVYIMAFLMPIIILIINLSTVSVVWFGAKLIAQDALNIGDMMAFMQYAMQVLFSILMITMIFILIPRAIVSVKRIREVFNIKPDVKDNGKLVEKEKIPARGEVEFKNVGFRYDKNAENILSDISFKVKKGETLAIIGPTGSGKSTILNLILRFYDKTEGTIKIGGIDIEKMKTNSLRDMIGYVPQVINLFTGTIKDNIKYGKQDATDNEVIEAAKISKAYDFITKEEKGFDSEVSQGGKNFSGGQKQRISIARAIVKKADIYLFDDSFSALDYTTDRNVRKAIMENMKDSTKIIVASRISTVLNADMIIYINEGKIVAKGTHKKLYNSNKSYKQLVLTQITEKEAIL